MASAKDRGEWRNSLAALRKQLANSVLSLEQGFRNAGLSNDGL
jgi:hypothetical protein